MSESVESHPQRIPLKWRHWLLVPLPGLVFSVTYCLVLRESAAGSLLPDQPDIHVDQRQWMRHRLGSMVTAIFPAALLSLVTYIVVASVLIRATKAGTKPGLGEVALTVFFLFLINTGIGLGGCSVGERWGRKAYLPDPAPQEPGRKSAAVSHGPVIRGFSGLRDVPGIR